jgi:hypothetical protein
MKFKTPKYLLLLLLAGAGCSKKAEIVPDVITPLYTLPQGNHAYDNTILDFHRTYGCYLLYKFSERDFSWNITDNINYVADQGDEDYIAPALVALDQYLLKFYSSDFLKKALPYKIILSSRVRKVVAGAPQATLINSISTVSQLTFGRAGSSLATMTTPQLLVMRGDLNREFWRQAVVLKKINLPPAFVAATNYGEVYSFTKKNLGVFMASDESSQNVYGDFIQYIYLIATKTKAELDLGQFLPANDPAGRFKLKYNAIIDYYKSTYGIDLQLIAKG